MASPGISSSTKKHKKHKSEKRERSDNSTERPGGLKLILKVGSQATPEHTTDFGYNLSGQSAAYSVQSEEAMQVDQSGEYFSLSDRSRHKKSKKKKKKKDKKERKHRHHHKEKKRKREELDNDENNYSDVGGSPSQHREPRTCVLRKIQERTPVQKMIDQLLGLLEKKDPQQFFAWPVTDNIAPGYSSIISQPMDFSTMRQKIEDNQYNSLQDFISDFKLMCTNAMKYNHIDTIYYKASKKLLHAGIKMMQPEKLGWIINLLPELTSDDMGFEITAELRQNKGGQDVDHDDSDHAEVKKRMPITKFEAIPDELTPEEILAKSQIAAREARAVLNPSLGMDISEDISMLTSVIGLHWIILFYMMKHKQLRNLYEHLSDFKTFGKPDNFESENGKLNFASKVFYYYCSIGITTYTLISVVQRSKCLRDRKTEFEICGLPVLGWFPVNLNHTPFNQFLCLWQLSGAILIMRGGAIVSFTTYETASHVAIRLRTLNKLLRECFDDDDNDKLRQEKLYNCVRYHVDVIAIFKKFNTCYENSMGVHICMTGVIFGCIANQMVHDGDLSAIIHLGGWIIALYVVCIGGQLIMDESEEVAKAAYDSKWYNASAKLQKDLVLIILRSQRKLTLRAGGFGILSLPLFMSIVKTSYSYLTLLNGSADD